VLSATVPAHTARPTKIILNGPNRTELLIMRFGAELPRIRHRNR
jgi:hypothetical protein